MLEKIKNFIKEHQGGISTVIGITGVSITVTLQAMGNPNIEQAEGIQTVVEFFKGLDFYSATALGVSILFSIKEKYLKD